MRLTRPQTKPLVALPATAAWGWAVRRLLVTPSHPVRVNGAWCRPLSVAGARPVKHSGFVYTLVLDDPSWPATAAAPGPSPRCNRRLLVEGVEAVTWGHGLEGPVVGHSFFGGGRVLSSGRRPRSDAAARPHWC